MPETHTSLSVLSKELNIFKINFCNISRFHLVCSVNVYMMLMFLGFDQLQNLVMCTQEGAELGMEINLLPLNTSQSHALTQLMTRCWSVDPKQRPPAEGQINIFYLKKTLKFMRLFFFLMTFLHI